MKVVIDTNVILSAAWRDKSPEAVVLWITGNEDWEWVVSEEILEEYTDVLRREKFNMFAQKIELWETIITQVTTHVEVNVEIQFPRDQKDAKFLACAISSKADYMITGDGDFSEAKKLINTTILSVSMFKRLMIDSE